MDKLFICKVDEMLERLERIEPEMREDSYHNKDDYEVEMLSKFAYMYLKEIFTYMKSNFKEERLTIAVALREFFLIATTGEVSKYQNWDDLCYVNQEFAGLSGFLGLCEAKYAAHLLRYYYLVYERDRGGKAGWEEVECEARKILGLSCLKKFANKIPRNTVDGMLSEQEFMPEFRKHMDTLVIGQDVVKKKLITILYQWIYNGVRTTLLMVGPSGSGKNHSIDAIKSFKGLGRVVISYDCSNLSPVGFEGASINDIFKKLKVACSSAGKSTDGSIVYLDEIDKIVNFNFTSNGESVNAMVQQQLLSSLAGTETIQGVDTSKILFILGGACPRINDLKKETRRQAMGFSPVEKSVTVDYKTTLREEICKIGGETEFVGRIEEIVQMSKLTREDLKAILLDKNIGAFTKKKKIFNSSGMDLEIEENAVESIVDLIEKEDAGARSVKNIMNEFADSQYFYDMKIGGYDKMIIHKGMLYGEAPIFINMKEGGKENEKRGKCS